MANPIESVDTAVIGAGIVGIAVAYYLATKHRVKDVVLIDPLDPMSLTSAQSGENYRNWWPNRTMTRFTDHSIDLMEEIAANTGERINMTRRGYALATRRQNPDDLIADLHAGYGHDADRLIRIHNDDSASSCAPAVSANWQSAPTGVDVLCSRALIRKTFPSYATDVATVLHVRRAGSISGQQLGQFMLEKIRDADGRLLRGKVTTIETGGTFRLNVQTLGGRKNIKAERVVNAAGPFFKDIASMLGDKLPVSCIFQQKIAFEDREQAVPRNLPFSIDLDGQTIDWSEEDRKILAEDPEAAKLLSRMPGGIHCRPDGHENGKWIKLGWAYNETPTDPHGSTPLNAQFPDIVLRGASRLNPALKTYIGRLPRNAHHYGGYYVMTPENWPLIGPASTSGAFMAGALSGFGTMAACATGEICASWAVGETVPAYAKALSSVRYRDSKYAAEMPSLENKGIL